MKLPVILPGTYQTLCRLSVRKGAGLNFSKQKQSVALKSYSSLHFAVSENNHHSVVHFQEKSYKPFH